MEQPGQFFAKRGAIPGLGFRPLRADSAITTARLFGLTEQAVIHVPCLGYGYSEQRL